DPLFVAPAGLNFQLQAASPARNAGEAVSPYTDGFAGTAPDIGALPFGQKPWTAGADPAANPFMRAVPAAPGHLTAAAAGDSVTLAWQDNSANETGFVLEGSPDALDFRPVASVPPGTASYTDSATIHRFYRVCAMNGWYQSPYSNTARCNATSASTSIAAWTLSVASNPAGVNWWNFFGDGHNWVKYSNLCFARSLDKVSVTYSTEAGAKYAGNRIEFRLDSPTGPVIGHVVTRSSGGWGNFITDSGAVSGVNSGAHDLYITFSPIDAPWPVVLLHTFEFSDTKGLAAPTGLAAAAVPDGSVDLSWTAATDNHAGFKIERATDALTFVEIAALEAGARSHRDTTAPPKQSCYYRIRAFNRAFGNSAYSNVAALVRGH
ncbi:MAG: carbohydrate-binding protein, partial [Planctomycetota bacterium]